MTSLCDTVPERTTALPLLCAVMRLAGEQLT